MNETLGDSRATYQESSGTYPVEVITEYLGRSFRKSPGIKLKAGDPHNIMVGVVIARCHLNPSLEAS